MSSLSIRDDCAVLAGLNLRQKAFVLAYLGPAKYYASRAAVMAGYSKNNPQQVGSRVRNCRKVATAIETLVRTELDMS